MNLTPPNINEMHERHDRFIGWLQRELERRALHCEELGRKEDQKPHTEKNIARIYGCGMAAQTLRSLASDIKLYTETHD